jgi:hypothetical protein
VILFLKARRELQLKYASTSRENDWCASESPR